ncbi:hypothetical protein JHK82_035402 [Glycine max]|nr:hypothetical protein JHK82_035402 [Glycine max]
MNGYMSKQKLHVCMCVCVWSLEPLLDFVIMTTDESCVDWIPGLKNFRLKDLPDFIRTTQIKITMVECFIESANNVHRASAVVINTSDELESDVLNAHTSMVPSLYPIGPFPSFLNQSPQKNHLASLGSNLWKEDTGCLL